jgi:hypothetical protein
MGGCIASDRITIDGARVGLLVRDPPERDEDSGWVFLSGDEPQEYLDNADNLAVYDVNTIANYDPSIIPYLYALPGQRFAWDAKANRFVETEDSEPAASSKLLPKGISVVQGRQALGAGWTIWLPTPFRRRTEQESLVLWRPSLTLWAAVAETKASSQADMLEELKRGISPNGFDVQTTTRRGLSTLSYRVKGDSADTAVPSLNAFVAGDRGYVQLGLYLDREEELEPARLIVDSVGSMQLV